MSTWLFYVVVYSDVMHINLWPKNLSRDQGHGQDDSHLLYVTDSQVEIANGNGRFTLLSNSYSFQLPNLVLES